jgi:hypothetical protein
MTTPTVTDPARLEPAVADTLADDGADARAPSQVLRHERAGTAPRGWHASTIGAARPPAQQMWKTPARETDRSAARSNAG